MLANPSEILRIAPERDISPEIQIWSGRERRRSGAILRISLGKSIDRCRRVDAPWGVRAHDAKALAALRRLVA
jgi:hypothetical protein